MSAKEGGSAAESGTAEAKVQAAKPATWKARLEGLLSEFGPIAVVVYFSIFFSVWAGFATAIAAGFSVEVGDGGVGAGMWGVIGAAYIPTKLTQPLRIGATFAVTPFAARIWRRIRGARA